MELIFYRKLLSLFGGLIIIIDLANAGMVPIGHPNNAKVNRPQFGKPIAAPGINTGPSVTVHGRPDRPGANSGYGPQPAMSFGINQKPPHPSSFASSQSSVGNSQSHLIYTQNTAGTGADPVMIVASTQNALNETENTHTVPLEQMASMFPAALTPPEEVSSAVNSQGPDPQVPAQDTAQQIIDNAHQNEVQTVPEIAPSSYSENSPSIPNAANQNNAVHIETPILSVASDATQTAENLQLAGQESVAAHIPTHIESSQIEISVANSSPENIPLSETNSAIVAQPPSSSLDSVHSPINSHVDATAVSSPSHADNDHEHHFDLEAYLAQANMVLGTSSSNIQPVQSATVLHPSENIEALEMNIANDLPASSIPVPEASDLTTSSIPVPEVSDRPTSSIPVPEASDLPTSSIPVPEASDLPTSSIPVPEASDLPTSSISVLEASDPSTSSISVPQASVPPVSPVSAPSASVSSTSPVSVPNSIVPPTSPVSVPVAEKPVPENLQLAEKPSMDIHEPLLLPLLLEIENAQNEYIASLTAPDNTHISGGNLSNAIPEVLSEQAILSMPNEVFEESVLNIEIAHETNVAQSQSNNLENDVVQLSDNVMTDASPIAPITIDHIEHLPIPSNPEVSGSNAEETLPLLSEASQVTPDINVVSVQLEEVLPEVQETNANPPLPPISVIPEETAVNAVVETSSTQIADTLINHTPLNFDAQNIYSSPVVGSDNTNASEDYDDPPFNVEQYLAQAALLLGSKSYQPYVHDDQQGGANDLYYSDVQNIQQSPDRFGKEKSGSGAGKGNQYYTHFGNKFTSSHGTGREHDGNNLKPKENIAEESKTSEQIKSNELSNKIESLDTPVSPSSHPSHSASTKPLTGPPFGENFDENILLTVVNPGNGNEVSGVEEESHELPSESKSVPDEANEQSFSSKEELERARPFRPGFARPSSLGLAPMYSYSGGILNTPLGEEIQLTEYSNIVPAASKNPNATAAAEPVKFPHNALMPLLGSSTFNSYFNGSHTNTSVPNTAASFIMAQAPGIPSPQAVPSLQHAVLNNSNIVTSMNNSQLKPTEFQSYYFPQESVKFANVLINNGGIRPEVGSKNVVESGIVFVVPPKSASESETIKAQNAYSKLNPGQSVVDLLAHDRKKATGNNHHVKRASASGKSLDKTNNRVSNEAEEDVADSELQEQPAEELENNSEKVAESQSAPENSVGPIVSDNSSEEKEDASVSGASPAQGEENPDKILNKEVGSQPLEEPKEDDSDNESDSQSASEQKEDDLDNESDSQTASELKVDDSGNESDSQQAAEHNEDDLDNKLDSQLASGQKEDDLENESDSQQAAEQNEDDSDNKSDSQPVSEQKEGDSHNEADSQSTSEQKEEDLKNESDSQPASEQKEDGPDNESDSQPAPELAEDDLNNKSDSQSNEKQESDLNVQQENVVSISQPESEVQETENSEKKKEADASSLEEDEYETEEEDETSMKDSEDDISNIDEQNEESEEPEVTHSENNGHKGAQPKHPVELAPSKSNNQEATKVKQPVEKEEAPVKAVPSRESPSKTQTPSKDSPPKGQTPPKEVPSKSQVPLKENPSKSQAPPKDTPQKAQAPSKEAPPKENLPKSQSPSREAPSKDSPPKAQAPSKDAPPKESPPKDSPPKAHPPSKETPPKETPPKEAPPKDSPSKAQTPSQETPPKAQAPSKDNPPKDPPPKTQAPPPSPPQKDAGPPAAGPSGPGLPPLPPPPALIAPPSIEAMAPPSLDQLQFSIPEPQFSIPDPQFAIPGPQFSIPEPNISPAMPPDVSEIIGAVTIPSFPTMGDSNKGSKGIPNPKPKPPKRPSTSNGPSKGSPQAQQNSTPDAKPHVNPQTPAILQQEIQETVEIYEEPEELSAAEMTISEELENVEDEDESMNLSDENEIQPQLEEEPSFTNEKALPNKNGGRPFPPGFGNANPNPMFGNPAYGPGAFPQVTPGSVTPALPDKGCTCNSNSAPGGGTNNNAAGSSNSASGTNNSNGSGKPNPSSNAPANSNNDKGNNSGGGKPNANNSNNDKGNSNGGGKPSANSNANTNNDKGNSNSGKHPSVPSKHNPAPTAAPVPAPVIDMDAEDDSNSNVRPPRPTKPKRPNRPSGGGKKPKPKPSDKNNDKLKDVEVEDDLDPDFLQAIANTTNIVFTPPKISDSKLESKPAANNASSSSSHNTPTKQTELFTIYSIFGWEIPVINWSYFTDIFQSFFVEKFRTSSGEFTCDESLDNEATILRSELDVDYLCGDDIDYGRRDIRTLADSNICNMFCNSNGYSSGLCMPQKSCLCYMSEKKNFAIKLDRLADFSSNTTEKDTSYGEDSCQNCRCLKSCQNNGKYVGYCSKSCHCGVPWYNEDPDVTYSSPQA